MSCITIIIIIIDDNIIIIVGGHVREIFSIIIGAIIMLS